MGEDTVEYTVAREAGEDIGDYTITPSGAATQGNYTVTYETGTFTITPKAVVVKANDDEKVYDNDPTNPGEYTATVTGLVGEDTVEYTVRARAGEDMGLHDHAERCSDAGQLHGDLRDGYVHDHA